MIININRQSLVEPLKNIVGVSEQNQTMPILGHVLVEIKDGVCFLTATDLEVQVSFSYDVEVSENIRITVPARKFTDILRSLEAENVTLEVTPKDIVIKSGKSKFRVSALNPDDFPIITDDISDCMKIDTEALLKLVNSTSFSMGYQDARHFLNGLFIEFSKNNIAAVATDGHRLAYSLRTCDLSSSEKTCIVPRKCINELKRILSSFTGINEILTEVSVSSKNIQFCMNGYTLLSKLVEGNYPDYNKVFPKSLPNNLKLDRLLLKSALQRLSILSSEQFKGVKFKLTNGLLNLSTINSQQESGDEIIECDYDGEELEIGFNLSYLLETLDVIDTQNIVIHLGGSDSGCLVTADGDETSKYIIMPMRV
jgi:DNA polymerase-3 subunit beta|tara:strand:+ start:2588 stop:3691 length:1104 start_codon:yes stop_codon:yes gene_type:complete